LTLFVIPALYVLFARSTSSPQHVSRVIDRLRETTAGKLSAGTVETPVTTSKSQSG